MFAKESYHNLSSSLEFAKENLKSGIDLSNSSFTIENSNPDNYLSTYIMACRTGAKLSVSPEIAEDFKKKFSVILDNEQLKKEEKDVSIPSMGNTLFNADKKATELCKLYSENKKEQTTSQKKKFSYDDDMEMCF